jgi:hypothetical protein
MRIARISKLIAILPLVVIARDAALANEGCMSAFAPSSTSGMLASEGGAYILTIASPICLKGEEELDNVAATTRLQVFPGSEPVQSALKSLVGKPVAIKGSFHGSRSKKFNAPILVDVSEAAPQ